VLLLLPRRHVLRAEPVRVSQVLIATIAEPTHGMPGMIP
jgi:hypothetical protein